MEHLADRVAVIPYSYIDDETVRVTIYRRLSGDLLPTGATGEPSTREAALDALYRELKDRFGPPPPAVERLLQTVRLRIRASLRGIIRIETRGDMVYLTGRNRQPLMDNGRHPRLAATTADNKLQELIMIIESQA